MNTIPTVTKAQLRCRQFFSAVLFFLPVILLLLAYRFLFVIGNVPSDSMEPTIYTGSGVFINKLAYTNKKIQRGDIICFTKGSSSLIKRVIGLPGDTITFSDGKLMLNGILLQEDYLPIDTITLPFKDGQREYIVPESEYFCLGDNREDSLDSRAWSYPFVRSSEIVGRALFTFPLNLSHGLYYTEFDDYTLIEPMKTNENSVLLPTSPENEGEHHE